MAAPRRRLRAAALVAIAAVAAPRLARAGVGGQYGVDYANSTTTLHDETGREATSNLESWVQRYRLNVENQLYPLLTLSGGGSLNWSTGSSGTGDEITRARVESDSKDWSAYARLQGGDRVLSGALDYSRRWTEAEVRQGGATATAPGIVRETFGGGISWMPSDLPQLTLRLSRAENHDGARQQLDQTNDAATLAASYLPVPELDLRYSLRYSEGNDHLTHVVRTEISNSAAVSWSRRYLEDRGNLYLGYNVGARTADVRAPAGAVVPVQQFPIAGLSVVEAFPATPTKVSLNPNAALVDGSVTESAGVNLGTAAGTGVIAYRDLGAQFQDVVTPVSLIYVYVDQDQQLTDPLAALFQWAAYRSNDNDTWELVPLAGEVHYNDVLFRFEVPIERTSARYLKVVTKPLPEPASTDPQFREIFVTELQFYDMVPAEQVRGRSSSVDGVLSGTTRLLLVRSLSLSYDFSGTVVHSQAHGPTWSIVNGLSLARRLNPVFSVGARAERSDSDAGAGHEASQRWSATLTANPLPTLGAVLSYSGQLAETREGTVTSHSGAMSARADLYQGVAVSATASSGWTRTASGVTALSLLGSVTGSVVPNQVVTLSSSFSMTDTTMSGGGLTSSHDRRGVVDASVSLAPFPALAMSGTVTRQFTVRGAAVTLWTASGAFSPFPGGQLQFRYGYSESYDTSARARTRQQGPALRWNIRSGWYLATSYVLRDVFTPQVTEHDRTVNANLLITLR